MKVRRKYNRLYENKGSPSIDNLIWVKYEDLNGIIHFEYCNDGTQQDYTMTPVELLKYKPVNTILSEVSE